MKYVITRLVLGCNDYIELSLEEYEEVKNAKENLMNALFVEEKLNYVLENFKEFELGMIDAAVDNMLYSDGNYSKIINDIHNFNRRIINLLSTCRLYMDHTAHIIHSIYGGDSSQAKGLKDKKATEYDAHIGYRAMEAIRNYSQHRDIPVTFVSRNSKRVETECGSCVKHAVIPQIQIAALSKGFKKEILKELQTMGEKIDIRPLIREYVASIGQIHLLIRKELHEDIIEWESTLKRVFDRFHAAGGKNVLGLAIVAKNCAGKRIDSHEIFEDFMTRRKTLERKNRNLTHIASHFVTSE